MRSKAPKGTSPAAPPEKAADRSPASGAPGDLETVAKSTLGRIPKAGTAKCMADDARAETEAHVAISKKQLRRSAQTISEVADNAVKTVKAVTQSRTKMTDSEQSAEFERVAREHGAEGDDRSFNDALRKLTRPRSPSSRP